VTVAIVSVETVLLVLLLVLVAGLLRSHAEILRRLETSGGAVTARIAANAAFELDAETSGGGVSSDLPVTVIGKTEPDRLKGAVNGGGKLVRLHTSGGSIRVEKAGGQTADRQ